MKRLVLIGACFSIILAGCAMPSREGVPPTPAVKLSSSILSDPVRANGILSAAVAPSPFSGSPSLLAPDSSTAINTNVQLGPPRMLASAVSATVRHKRPRSSVPVYDLGGQAGVQIPGGNGYIGIYSVNTAYESSQIQLNPWDPSDPTNEFDILYAPTTHGSDGACLENGTDYWRQENASTTTANFRVFNGCAAGGGTFILAKNIGDTFVNKYVRYVDGGDTPTYITEVVKLSDGWHSLLYNFNTSVYEDLVGAISGNWNFNGGQGWDMFETHYTIGPCSAPPKIVAGGIRLESPDGSWNLIDSTDSQKFSYGDCINTGVTPYTKIKYPSPPTITDPQGTEWAALSN